MASALTVLGAIVLWSLVLAIGTRDLLAGSLTLAFIIPVVSIPLTLMPYRVVIDDAGVVAHYLLRKTRKIKWNEVASADRYEGTYYGERVGSICLRNGRGRRLTIGSQISDFDAIWERIGDGYPKSDERFKRGAK